MEKDDTFILMSMKDKNSKELANAISNETSRKIIAYLSDKDEATETQIAKDLNLPLTTIHYNIKLLLNSKLIQSKEFYWSKKGKEMLVYKLSKKFIIIAPSDSPGALARLKSLLPVTLLAFIGSGIIYLLQKGKSATIQSFEKIIPILDESGNKIGETVDSITKGTAGEMASDAGSPLVNNISGNIPNKAIRIIETIIPEPNYALWFLLGSLFIILLVFLFNSKKKR